MTSDSQRKERPQIQLNLLEPLIFPLVPRAACAAITAIWKIDSRLADQACAPIEPMLRAIRLRWWAERISAIGDGEVAHEPLLEALGEHWRPELAGPLQILSLAWEDLAIADTGARVAPATARGEALYAATTVLLGVEVPDGAGVMWSLTDASLRWPDDHQIRASATAAAGRPAVRGLPRSLAALDALARQIVRAAGRRHPVREQWVIFRAGLLGF